MINVVDFSNIKIKPATWQWKEELEMEHKRSGARLPPVPTHVGTEHGEIGGGAPAVVKRNRKKTRKGRSKQKMMINMDGSSAPLAYVSDSDIDSFAETHWTSDDGMSDCSFQDKIKARNHKLAIEILRNLDLWELYRW